MVIHVDPALFADALKEQRNQAHDHLALAVAHNVSLRRELDEVKAERDQLKQQIEALSKQKEA